MPAVDRAAPPRFLATAFRPDDWIAVLLKSYDSGRTMQRVGPVAMVADPRFQAWLRFQNARRFNVYVSVNAIRPGRRSRTREAIGAIRHVFLEADHDGPRVLADVAARPDLPPPSYVLHSSPKRVHIFWRVQGFAVEQVEALQKQLARELHTDPAATSASQLTRLPGFFYNYKYTPPQIVDIGYDQAAATAHGVQDFPAPLSPAEPLLAARVQACRRDGMPMIERARRYLAAAPPAIQGQHGDSRTFGVCCRLVGRFELTEDEAMELLPEWNAHCQPPWTVQQLAAKLRSAKRYDRVRPARRDQLK